MVSITRDHLIRIFVLLLLPFLLGFWILPHVTYVSGQTLGAPSENQSGLSLSYTYNPNNTGIAVPERVNAVFPLADYLDFPPFVRHGDPLICFEDTGSYVVLPNGTEIYPSFDWDVHYGSDTVLDVPKNSANCTKSLAGQNNTYRWVAKLDIDLSGQNLSQNITFIPKTSTYPKFAVDYGLLQGLVMIPVCYLFIWYPAAGIWKKIHKGMAEQ